MFSQHFGSGTDEPVIKGKREKNEWLIRPSTDHLVLNIVVQWFNFTLAWKKGNMSRPRLYGQDFWPRSLSTFLWTETSVKSQKKELGQHPAILTSRLIKTHMNIFYADPYNSGKGREYKKCTSEPGIFLTHKSVDFLFLVIRFMRC